MIDFIIPTLGSRPESLDKSVKSCLEVPASHVHIIGPKGFERFLAEEILGNRRVSLYEDVKTAGAAVAINQVLESPKVHLQQFFTWLGDDDELYPSKVYNAAEALKADPKSVAVFGEVEYFDSTGMQIFVNSGPRAPLLSLTWGPQKIPQPGSLFRTNLLSQIGALDSSYICAWDQDYFARASKVGKIMRVPDRVARYFWGQGTLSLSNLETSLAESARIRLLAMPRLVAALWTPVELARIVLVLTLGTRLTPAKGYRKAYRSINLSFVILFGAQDASL